MLQHDFWCCRLSSQPSDRSLFTVCWSCLRDNHGHRCSLHIKTLVLVRHDSRHAVCLHSPQTGICSLRAGTLGSLSMTLSIIVRLRILQTGVCLMCVEVPFWLQPLASPSVSSQESFLRLAQLLELLYLFIALRSKSVYCVLCARTYIFPVTTLGVAVCLCSHQTVVSPLHAGAYLARPSA